MLTVVIGLPFSSQLVPNLFQWVNFTSKNCKCHTGWHIIISRHGNGIHQRIPQVLSINNAPLSVVYRACALGAHLSIPVVGMRGSTPRER